MIRVTEWSTTVTTAIIGAGNIGGALARHLVRGGEQVVVAAKGESKAAALAAELGPLAAAASVPEAIEVADVVVFAVWFDALKTLIGDYGDQLDGKIVADPSNPLGFAADGTFIRTLPEGQSQASLVASMLPAGAHYVKAFGTLGADSFASSANRVPRRAVLFYATDDQRAGSAVERLITICGFDPVRAGGLNDAWRIEMPGGDLHQGGGLEGRLLDTDEARAAVAAG
jgi:8-hydroxy-5-deazaflavin:NADPH oxidoreductase